MDRSFDRETVSWMIETNIITAAVDDMAGLESLEPVPVPWWSFTKTVLAAAALALVANNGLNLDEPVCGYSFSLRHLLQHRSGLPDYGQLRSYQEAAAGRSMPWDRNRLLRQVGADRLVFRPGEGWAYSNVGYLFVREWIECTSDRELDPALDELVLSPLGISDARIVREPAQLEASAWGNSSGYHPGWVYHGLLVGPAISAALLLHRLLGGDLLPPWLLAEMLTPHVLAGPVPGRPWRTAGYGLGLMIGTDETGASYVGHTGGGPGSTAAVYQRIPDLPGVGPRRTAGAFAPVEDPAIVERRAVVLAMNR